MTGPIMFEMDEPFEFLKKRGYVVTARDPERTTGRTWCNRGRGETKEFDVDVTRITTGPPGTLDTKALAGASGFGWYNEWLSAIAEKHVGGEVGFYLVTRVEEGEDA